MARKFYVCKHCGNLVGMIEESGVPMICCGEEMALLEANTVEASAEKHLPVAFITKENDRKVHVKVGKDPHPMTDEHHISWIYLETKHGGQRKNLDPGKPAEADFLLTSGDAVSVYAYCNLHGLWKTIAFVNE